MTPEAPREEIKIADVKIVSWTKEKTERFGFTFPEDAKQNAVFAIALDKEENVLKAKYMPGFDSSKYIGDRDYKKEKDREADEFFGFARPAKIEMVPGQEPVDGFVARINIPISTAR